MIVSNNGVNAMKVYLHPFMDGEFPKCSSMSYKTIA